MSLKFSIEKRTLQITFSVRPSVRQSIPSTFQCISFSSAHASDLVCRLYLQRIWQITLTFRLPVAARVSVTCPCVRHCPGVRHMPGCVRISIRLVDVLVHILFFQYMYMHVNLLDYMSHRITLSFRPSVTVRSSICLNDVWPFEMYWLAFASRLTQKVGLHLHSYV